jgi:two-component system LytT family response regulator
MSDLLRVLIVDDERLARLHLRQLLHVIPAVECAGEAHNAEAALTAVRSIHPDVILLDVQMPGLDGFDVVNRLPPSEMPAVIFVTAHDHYAVKAFDVHATDYVLKPPDPDRLARALDAARQRLQSRTFAAEQAKLRALIAKLATHATGIREIIARDHGRAVRIPVSDIDWLQAEDNYVRIHSNGASHLVRATIGSLERDLDAGEFIRIHRSAIVNVGRVRELRRSLRGGYSIVLQSGARLKVSRAYRRRVVDLFRHSG